MTFSIRQSIEEEAPLLEKLMHAAIGQLQQSFLSDSQIKASYEFIGIDHQLIIDGTYYTVLDQNNIIAGCGGWSRRDTLFGGDHSPDRNPRLLNPKSEPARIRAMYTNPEYTRLGVGKLIINHCEAQAKKEGFRFCTLASTLAGKSLYTRCVDKPIEYFDPAASNGTKIPLIRMKKALY
jgi:GNAT superfamily N-acetyltransferase